MKLNKKGQQIDKNGDFHCWGFLCPSDWHIVEPEKRYAKTPEEALRAKEIRIEWPEYTGNSFRVYVKNGFWLDTTIAIIHTALDLGCKVEILE